MFSILQIGPIALLEHQGRQIAARLLRKVMRPLILVLCENRAHFISLAEMSNACNLRNNPWDDLYETWQRLTKEIRRKTWQFVVSLATGGIGWNGKILTNCSMPFWISIFICFSLYGYHSSHTSQRHLRRKAPLRWDAHLVGPKSPLQTRWPVRFSGTCWMSSNEPWFLPKPRHTRVEWIQNAWTKE